MSPVAPVLPGNPVAPVVPVNPVAPVLPAGPVAPVDPVKPVAPSPDKANTPLPYNTLPELPSKLIVDILPMPVTFATATELAVPAVTA